MTLRTAVEQSEIARRMWHTLPDRVRVKVSAIVFSSPRGQWAREVMNRDIEELLASLDPTKLNVIEISGADRTDYPWASYTRTEYPEFDLCDPSPTHDGRYDLVICEQVLEHVEDPVTAVRNLKALCNLDGRLLVSTPFLIRIHPTPRDFWRFTPDGLRKLLESQDLRVEWVRSWGNRAVVRRNFRFWARYRPWQSLKNEPNFPVVVWALARVADASKA